MRGGSNLPKPRQSDYTAISWMKLEMSRARLAAMFRHVLIRRGSRQLAPPRYNYMNTRQLSADGRARLINLLF